MEDAASGVPGLSSWPELSVSDWSGTRDTLHLWSQVVGKVRLALAPRVNHWWHITLYVTARGLTTSLMPYGTTAFEMVFDFRRHELAIEPVDRPGATIALAPRSVADFYGEVMARLDELGLGVEILARPVEVVDATPFADDHEHASYDPDYAHRFWQSLVQAERVLARYRAGFQGKVSTVHFFWGAFDLAVTRFSGREAPRHPGGAPNCADWVMVDAYSHEVSSAGYWPGGTEEGVFYSYAYPEPEGFSAAPMRSAGVAGYDESLGEFVLPYGAVRQAEDPDGLLLGFLEDTYAAAADLGKWDRVALEYPHH
jgi:Family of unknown function (DUF5996)